MTAEQRAFLDMAVPLAQKEARRAGILASLTLAQAIVESNWGRSILATGGHNYFGIKGDWLGKSITKNTGEYINGQAIRVDAAFRAIQMTKPDLWTTLISCAEVTTQKHGGRKISTRLLMRSLQQGTPQVQHTPIHSSHLSKYTT